MAIIPSIPPGDAAASLRGLPFWDPGAFPSTGSTPNSYTSSPGIWSFLPESPNDPWPDSVSQWLTIKFNGTRAPGIAHVKGGRRRRIDLRQTPGASGATASNMGYDPGDFSVELLLWTPKQFIWLQNMMSMLVPPPTAKVQPRAVKIDHVGLKLIGITDAYVESVAIPEIDDHQFMRVEIDCIEFLPQLNEGGGAVAPAAEWTQNPDGTYSSSTRTPPPDPSQTSNGP